MSEENKGPQRPPASGGKSSGEPSQGQGPPSDAKKSVGPGKPTRPKPISNKKAAGKIAKKAGTQKAAKEVIKRGATAGKAGAQVGSKAAEKVSGAVTKGTKVAGKANPIVDVGKRGVNAAKAAKKGDVVGTSSALAEGAAVAAAHAYLTPLGGRIVSALAETRLGQFLFRRIGVNITIGLFAAAAFILAPLLIFALLMGLIVSGGATALAACTQQANSASITLGNWDASKSSQAYNAKYIFFALRSFGWTPAAAAGTLGNFENESSFDPWILEGTAPYSAKKPPSGPKGCPSPGMGIAQWGWQRDGENCAGSKRFNALVSDAQKSGKDPFNLQTQVEWVVHETNTYTEFNGWQAQAKKITDPSQAAYQFHHIFESSGDGPSAIADRMHKATVWYKKFKDLPVPSEFSGGTVASAGPVFIVGDSLTEGSKSYIQKNYKKSKTAVTIDSKVSRSTPTGISILKSSKKAKAAKTWIVALGTNDGVSTKTYNKYINKVMSLAGTKSVYWMNVRRPGVDKPINAAIASATSRYSNYSVIDFNGKVSKNYISDPAGVHLNSAGYKWRAELYNVTGGLNPQPAAPKPAPPARIKRGDYTGPTYYPLKNWKKASVGSGAYTHDVGEPVGTPVYAVRDGVVTKSVDLKGFEPRIPRQNGYYSYGRVIYIKYAGVPVPMTHAHLSKRFVKTGDKVVAGQVIGLTGETGHAYGPHLHLDFNNVTTAVAWIQKNAEGPPPVGGVNAGLDNLAADGGGTSTDGACNTANGGTQNTVSPDSCPTKAPAGMMRDGSASIGVAELCKRSVAQARTPEAAKAIIYAFSKLGAPYSYSARSSPGSFDCTYFIDRAYLDGAGVKKFFGQNGFPYTVSYSDQFHNNWKDVLVKTSDKDHRPGDIRIMWLPGSSIEGSGGAGGHGQMYLSDGFVIQSGGGGDKSVNVSNDTTWGWPIQNFAFSRS